MTYKPVKTKDWVVYIEHHGFRFNRIKGSHHHYTKKGFRTIPVWGKKKEIPAMHINVVMRETLNKPYSDFEDFLNNKKSATKK